MKRAYGLGFRAGAAPLRWLVTLLALSAAAAALGRPRNVILMIADGMGPDAIAAAGAYKYGAAHRAFGGDKCLAMEALQGQVYVTTFGAANAKGYDFKWDDGNKEYPKRNLTDEAAAATALATGIKVANYWISMDAAKKPLRTILEVAQQCEMRAGVVTNLVFCYATPAAFAAHEEKFDRYAAIAHDMLFETQPDVIMGAGYSEAASSGRRPPSYISQEDWQAVKDGKTPYRVISTREEFQKLITDPGEGKVLGLFRSSSGLAHRGADGAAASAALPTLEEMTKGALAALKNDKGFFLMVNSGTIESCVRSNDLNRSVGEVLAFDEAVAAVIAWIGENGGWERNLLVVTGSCDSGYLWRVQPAEAGTLPTVAWGTTEKNWRSRTNRLVKLFAQGARVERLLGYRRQAKDFERGAISYIDNVHVCAGIYYALNPP